MPQAVIKPVLGSMTFGRSGTLGARIHTAEGAAKLIDLFQQHGYKEIDTARVYGDGTTEQILSELGWQKRGLQMQTKIYPSLGKPLQKHEPYTHKPEDLRRGLTNCLKNLQCDKVDLFYLHGPDRNTPYEDTLRELNDLHKEGKFDRLGISNYWSWEVAEICTICEKNGWIKPSVYQGIYNALQRSIEAELIPCLRRFGISLYSFQPLAGGFLTGRYKRDQADFEPGSRFDPGIWQGNLHRGRYWNDLYFDAMDLIRGAAEKHGLSDAEVVLRWLEHHSQLKAEHGDTVIVGASSVKHLDENLKDLEKGPLPEDVVEALDLAWMKTKAVAPKYWH